MCGVAGFVSDLRDNESILILKSMLSTIKHRGPDQSGAYISRGLALCSVRLSIQDIASGNMPISNEDQTIWIVFNGEIFNFIELRRELELRGHRFSTSSDTEVIVHLYEEFGFDFLNRLNGQFAIAIYDKNRRELILARDRVGIRPLFYKKTRKGFVFGSEIKALSEYPGIQLSINKRALQQYFTFWTALSPETIFDEVYEVSPGSYLRIRLDDLNVQTKRYWNIPIYPEKGKTVKELGESIEQFKELFTDSVKLRLRSDVPVAAYLSGGLDSAITTSFIKNIHKGSLKTFSIGFDNKDFDESQYQNIVVEHLQTDHFHRRIKDNDIAENFEKVVWHAEAPLLRTSPVPMFCLSENVRNHNTKVVITGEGADELFGGYNIYKETKIRHFWSKDPNSKIRPLLLKRLYPYLDHFNRAGINAIKPFFGHKLKDTDSPIYSHLLRWHNTSRLKGFLSQEVVEEMNNYDPVEKYKQRVAEKMGSMVDLDYLTKASYIEIDLFLSGYLLSSQGDRMAMANSVEGRYPFLDHRIIDFALSLKSDLRLRGLNEKYFLKKMIGNMIPDEIINRPKQAYRAPIRNALLNSHENEKTRFLGQYLDIIDTNIFNKERVDRLKDKYRKDQQISEMDNMSITGILSTQILINQFVNKSGLPKFPKPEIQFDKLIID